ncbi:tRNA uridine-5-carboxymethylaminomethyl(34) synthesis GTPase MnmE [Thalassococcus sp. BH17M4-6]|uniref:tRNA uridine-5-carboxymethylaminomethyl(34) synthesis GTPase MnmE n=1 Tax=Thalassococcus sp. BH17M4-6 TaxID=3413148 RepID=UPI003BCF0C6C
METIFALATAQGKSGVAVIRISGPEAVQALAALTQSVPEYRRASLRRLSASDETFLDEALVMVFEDGASFTGEPVVELQLHGSVAVVRAVLGELAGMPGLRQAEPGEFTRRALENGRLDLTQVEGLADLIEAETESQRRQALRVLSGDLGTRVTEWRRDLIGAASLLEATIDFADEDVPVDVTGEVLDLIDRVDVSLRKELSGFGGAERIRTGFEVAIVGAPNVGKSTLLNAIAGRDAAITSEIAGTTRDVIEVRLDLRGIPVTLLDTAGLRETEDAVEALGVARAKSRAEQADLRVYLIGKDDTAPETRHAEDLVVTGKSDLHHGVVGVSGATGQGIDQLIEDIAQRLAGRAGGAGLVTRERHRAAVQRSVCALQRARDVVALGSAEYDIAAEELRTAIRQLSALIGQVDVENLLDEIFASFCLGK